VIRSLFRSSARFSLSYEAFDRESIVNLIDYSNDKIDYLLKKMIYHSDRIDNQIDDQNRARFTAICKQLNIDFEAIPLFEPDGLIEIGDRDFLQEMVDLAIETTELRLIELRAAIEAEDWLQIGEVSHQLKSPLRTCGAKRMTAIATRMKEQAEGDGPSRVVETYQQSVEIWYKTRSAMQDYLEKA